MGIFFLRSKRLAAAKINLMKSLTELPVVCVCFLLVVGCRDLGGLPGNGGMGKRVETASQYTWLLIQTDVAGLTVYELLNKMVRNKTSGALPGRISCGNNNRMLLWLIHKLVLGASTVYCIRFGVSFCLGTL